MLCHKPCILRLICSNKPHSANMENGDILCNQCQRIKLLHLPTGMLEMYANCLSLPKQYASSSPGWYLPINLFIAAAFVSIYFPFFAGNLKCFHTLLVEPSSGNKESVASSTISTQLLARVFAILIFLLMHINVFSMYCIVGKVGKGRSVDLLL